MTGPDRIPCCIPFCRRTAPRSGKFANCSEIICGKHWRLARASRRRLQKRLLREIDRDPRGFWEMPPGSKDRLRRVKTERLLGRLWAAIKREATETAAGLA